MGIFNRGPKKSSAATAPSASEEDAATTVADDDVMVDEAVDDDLIDEDFIADAPATAREENETGRIGDVVEGLVDEMMADNADAEAEEAMAAARASEVGSMIVAPGATKVAARRRKSKHSFSELDSLAAEIIARQREEGLLDDGDADVLDQSKMTRKERKAMIKALKDTFGGSGAVVEGYEHLMAIKPREGYLFHSDYFTVDGAYACVLSYFHDDAAEDGFGPFWGTMRIPHNINRPGEPPVTAVLLEQVSRMGEKWVDDNLKKSDQLSKLEAREQSDGGTMSTKRKSAKVSDDMMGVVAEIQNGAAYLNVHQRLLLRTTSLEHLDETLERIKRTYIESLSTVHAAPYHGEQRQELENFFGWNKNKRGNGFYFTSTEFAGAYSLTTNGLNDPDGEHVGQMAGDINSSAILFNVDGWTDHVVVADSAVDRSLGLRNRMSDLWGSKISQAALLNNHRVVHLVLNDAELDQMGPRFENLTSRVDLNKGEVNMFEIFGSVEDELSLFSTHVEKLVLMTEQAYGSESNEVRVQIRSRLSELINEFYIQQRMWAPNAKENRDRLRLVGIPHTEVPRLEVFIANLDSAYEAQKTQGARADADVRRGIALLRDVFRDLLTTHNDLFNNHTSDRIDSINSSRRVIYDFSTLTRRGMGVAMAQLVNIVAFAVESLSEGDVVIIHGAQEIKDSRVQAYLHNQFKYLTRRGGRVAYLYDDVASMLETEAFNKFRTADWTALGSTDSTTVENYEAILNEAIPDHLKATLSNKGSQVCYLRRKYTNVLFQPRLSLGLDNVSKNWVKEMRERKRLAAADAAALGGMDMTPSAAEMEANPNSRHDGDIDDIMADAETTRVAKQIEDNGSVNELEASMEAAREEMRQRMRLADPKNIGEGVPVKKPMTPTRGHGRSKPLGVSGGSGLPSGTPLQSSGRIPRTLQ